MTTKPISKAPPPITLVAGGNKPTTVRPMQNGIDSEDFRQKWKDKDLWSKWELISLLCGLNPDMPPKQNNTFDLHEIDRATNAIQRGIAAGTLEVAAYIQDEYQDLSFVSPDTVPYFTPASAIKWVRLADFPRFPVFSTKLEIDWQFWRVMRKVSPWQACALSLGIDPDSLEESKLSRKWHENGPTFESRSFPSTTAEDEFRKRLRLLNAARSDRAVFTQPMEKYSDLLPGEMLLAEFVAWALAIGLPNLPTELKMVVPKSQEKEEIVNVGQIPDQRVTKHTLKTRRHILDPAIDKAIQNAGSHDTAAVFLSLVELALAEEAPFTGHREGDALFYTDANDKSAKLTKDALSARLRRRIEATDSRQ